jgi:probable rRNA maturation factor
MNTIDIAIQDARSAGEGKLIENAAHRALAALKVNNAHVEITIASQEYMRKLNVAFRSKKKPTNVLSFPVSEPMFSSGHKTMLGEIYVSPAFVHQHNQSIEHMVVHGILHLLGYDHETAKERAVMEGEEERVLGMLS